MDLVIDKANDNFIQRQFVSQGDYRGRTLTVQVTDNGLIGQVPGLTLNLRWRNQASGAADLSAFECIDVENSVFRIEYPVRMMTPGKVVANIQVIQNGQATHLKTFEMTVQALAGEMAGIVSQAEYGALVAVLADANKFRTDIETLEMEKADKIEVAEGLENLDEKYQIEVDRLQDTKANQSFVDSQFAAIVSGAPKGTYATLADLTAAYPAGTSGVFLVLANGHWYYWAVDAWLDGGPYLAGEDKQRTRTASIITQRPFDVDTANNQLVFDAGYTAVTNSFRQYDLPAETNFPLTLESGFLFFDTLNLALKVVSKSSEGLDTDLALGWFFQGMQYYFYGDYTVDGETPMANQSVPIPALQPLTFSGQILSTKPLIVDPDAKTITFQDAVTTINFGNFNTNLSERGTTWDLSDRNANYLAYNTVSGVLESLSSVRALTATHVYCGYINWGSNFAVDLNANYVVRKGKGTGSLQKKWIGKTFAAIGDSITAGDNGIGSGGSSVSWVAQMALMCGFSAVTNVGKNGSRVAVRPSKTDSFVERVDQITGITGVITVWGGINDFHWNTPIGTFSDGDTANFYAAYRYVIETLQTNNPEAKILCITPMKANKFTPTFDAEGKLSVNETGATQLDYVEAIKDVAGYYSVPVLDMYNESSQNAFNEQHAALWFGDGLHPSNAGYLRIADQIASRMELL